MNEFNAEEYRKLVQYELEKGISEKRKEEIRKELETMSSQEVNHEIEELYNAMAPLLKDNVDTFYDIFESILHVLLEGKFVVDICDKIDNEVKIKFNKLYKKTELALEFAKKYFQNEISSGEQNYLDLLFFDINKIDDKTWESDFKTWEARNDKYNEIHDECEIIHNESEEYLQEYRKLYAKAIKLYIEEDSKYLEYISEMEELNNKVEENNKKILSKDEIISILKNINIEE